jgi:hypothetical protein
VAIKLVPIWLAYKGAMMAVNTAQKIQEAITSKLIPLFKQQTTALEGSATAAGAFKAQLIATGIGAFAIAIGLIIEKLSAMNAEFMESIEKISRIKELAGKDKGMQGEYKNIENVMMAGISGLSSEQRADVYERVNKLIKANEDAVAMDIMPSIKAIDRRMGEIPDITKQTYSQATQEWKTVVKEDPEKIKLRESRASILTSLLNYNSANESLYTMRKDLENAGVGKNGPGAGRPNPFGGFGDKNNAINTSALAGAKGGLGEAKVINIKIDTMQKVVTTDNRQLKQKGQDAVEVMLRTVNNIVYSSSQTQ